MFEQCAAYACVLRLIENGTVSVSAAVHVDDILPLGSKNWCHRFWENLNKLVPVNNLGEFAGMQHVNFTVVRETVCWLCRRRR